MKVRFQADKDLCIHIVTGVVRRLPEIEFREALSAELDGVPDDQVLVLCATEGRVLVTHDVSTMPVHFAEFVSNRQSPGVLLISQDLPIGEAIESLILIWELSEADEWINLLCRIPSLDAIVSAHSSP